MTPSQILIYQSLSRALGGKVIDPKYAPAHRKEGQLAKLKQWCREKWCDERDWPWQIDWVRGYVRQWKAEKDSGKAGGENQADAGGVPGSGGEYGRA